MWMASAGQTTAACRTSAACSAGGSGLSSTAAVLVALVEHVRGGDHALPGSDALVLVDGHFHETPLVVVVVVCPPCGGSHQVTGSS